jgi:Holliday junction DNA helicase RuvA
MREDGPSLYAFATDVERRLFRMLLGVSRVGPGMAIQVLSSCSPADFKRYILDEDADTLKSMVKGIGAKTARRLIAELQGPIEELPVAPAESIAGRAARDAVQALAALGESQAAAQKAVQEAVQELGPEASAEELVELALKS